MTESSPFLAFVDESGSDSHRDPGTYILSAAIITQDDIAEVRTAMTSLILPGQKKLHWRDESSKRQMEITKTISGLPSEHLIIVRDNAQGDRIERRRRACLSRLLYELDSLAVGSMMLESRGQADDKKDRKVLNSSRSTGAISSNLRMEHTPGPAEPALWVPDAVCGAMVGKRVGEPLNWAIIENQCTIYICP